MKSWSFASSIVSSKKFTVRCLALNVVQNKNLHFVWFDEAAYPGTRQTQKSDTDNSTISFVCSIKYERPPTWMNCLEADHATYYQYGTDLNVQRRPAARWILNILCI